MTPAWRPASWRKPTAAVLLVGLLGPLGASRPDLVQAQAAGGAWARLTDPAVVPTAPEAGGGDLGPRMRTFLAALDADARAAGVSGRTLAAALHGLEPDPSIAPRLDSQPEHVLAPWDYMARLVSVERIADGRAKLAEHGPTLERVERDLGVDRHIVAAIWGVESSYGTRVGPRSVVRSLATLAVADERRTAFWRRELIAALTILERGDVPADQMVGSWAGAMGHTQFMPTSYLANAIDFDGDGRRDIWRSVPDALGSTGQFLRRAGWQPGMPWGLEVVLPAGFDFGRTAPGKMLSAAEWRSAGVALPFDRPWPASIKSASLLLPAGRHGPAFLVTDNFRALLRYNNAISYALAVGHLADRLAGGPPLASPWPTDDPPLSVPERRELQACLATLGHDVGPIDGVIGDGTREALRAWQRENGLPADGWAGTRLLSRLRQATAGLE